MSGRRRVSRMALDRGPTHLIVSNYEAATDRRSHSRSTSVGIVAELSGGEVVYAQSRMTLE